MRFFHPGELNVGAIVATVVVLLILLGLIAFGIWFAYSRGYFNSEYCPPGSALPFSWQLLGGVMPPGIWSFCWRGLSCKAPTP